MEMQEPKNRCNNDLTTKSTNIPIADEAPFSYENGKIKSKKPIIKKNKSRCFSTSIFILLLLTIILVTILIYFLHSCEICGEPSKNITETPETHTEWTLTFTDTTPSKPKVETSTTDLIDIMSTISREISNSSEEISTFKDIHENESTTINRIDSTAETTTYWPDPDAVYDESTTTKIDYSNFFEFGSGEGSGDLMNTDDEDYVK